MMSLNKRKITLLFFIVWICGTFLRFYGLSSESLWFDEFFSLKAATENNLWTLLTTSIDALHPPLYYVLLRINILLLGNEDWVLRIPSAIFGSLSIVSIFFLGKKLYTEKEGLVAAFILAFSSYAIFYSQEVRSYSLFLLLSIWSVYFLIDIFFLLKEKVSFYQIKFI